MPKEKDPPLKSSRTIHLERLLEELDTIRKIETLNSWHNGNRVKIEDLRRAERRVFDAAIVRKRSAVGVRPETKIMRKPASQEIT